MPSQLRLERDQHHRLRWQRRLSRWGFAILLLAAIAVVIIELLT